MIACGIIHATSQISLSFSLHYCCIGTCLRHFSPEENKRLAFRIGKGLAEPLGWRKEVKLIDTFKGFGILAEEVRVPSQLAPRV